MKNSLYISLFRNSPENLAIIKRLNNPIDFVVEDANIAFCNTFRLDNHSLSDEFLHQNPQLNITDSLMLLSDPTYTKKEIQKEIFLSGINQFFHITIFPLEDDYFCIRLQEVRDKDLLTLITDSMPTIIAYWNKDLYCVYANKQFGNWFKKDLTNIIGQYQKDVIGEKLFTMNYEFTMRALKGEPQSYEREMIMPDGEIKYTKVQYVPNNTSDGIAGYFVSIVDVTDIRKREMRLNEITIQQQIILENEIVGIARVQDRKLIWVNPAFEKTLGYGREELTGLSTRLIYETEEMYKTMGDKIHSFLQRGNAFRFQIKSKKKTS